MATGNPLLDPLIFGMPSFGRNAFQADLGPFAGQPSDSSANAANMISNMLAAQQTQAQPQAQDPMAQLMSGLEFGQSEMSPEEKKRIMWQSIGEFLTAMGQLTGGPGGSIGEVTTDVGKAAREARGQQAKSEEERRSILNQIKIKSTFDVMEARRRVQEKDAERAADFEDFKSRAYEAQRIKSETAGRALGIDPVVYEIAKETQAGSFSSGLPPDEADIREALRQMGKESPQNVGFIMAWGRGAAKQGSVIMKDRMDRAVLGSGTLSGDRQIEARKVSAQSTALRTLQTDIGQLRTDMRNLIDEDSKFSKALSDFGFDPNEPIEDMEGTAWQRVLSGIGAASSEELKQKYGDATASALVRFRQMGEAKLKQITAKEKQRDVLLERMVGEPEKPVDVKDALGDDAKKILDELQALEQAENQLEELE